MHYGICANCLLADLIRIWYVFREKAVENLYDCNYSDLGAVNTPG